MNGSTMVRSTLAVAVSLAIMLVLPVGSLGSGGTSIAEAPSLNFGVMESGGGRMLDFWRVRLFAGDVMTFDVDVPSGGDAIFDLFDPTVTDYTFDKAQNVASSSHNLSGKHQFTLQSPFTGLGTLVVCASEDTNCNQGGFEVLPYTFTATVAHAAHLTISAPVLARRHSTVTVRIVMQSPAGIPQGACLIQGADVPLAGGQCSRRLRLGRGKRQTIHASFVPDDGWQAASGHRTIRLAR